MEWGIAASSMVPIMPQHRTWAISVPGCSCHGPMLVMNITCTTIVFIAQLDSSRAFAFEEAERGGGEEAGRKPQRMKTSQARSSTGWRGRYASPICLRACYAECGIETAYGGSGGWRWNACGRRRRARSTSNKLLLLRYYHSQWYAGGVVGVERRGGGEGRSVYACVRACVRACLRACVRVRAFRGEFPLLLLLPLLCSSISSA
eukprot:1849727-Rhodomonas_salina.1